MKYSIVSTLGALLLAGCANSVPTPSFAQSAGILPNARTQFVNANGQPIIGGSVGFYVPSTLTPKTTWQNSTESITNSNPITLDSLGSALVYGSGSYREILKDANGNLIWDSVTTGISVGTSNGLLRGDGVGGISAVTLGNGLTLYGGPPGGTLGYTYSVTTFGAVGNNSPTADTTAFQAAITAACSTATATGGVAEVEVPVPPVSYTITAPLTMCQNLHIHGVGGYATVHYTGTGTLGTPSSLFVNSGSQSVEIDHLDWVGSNNGYVYGYRAATNAISDINVRIHDNLASSWGNGTTGGLWSIESDSGANAFYNNYVSAQTAVFSITAPTDRLDVYDNLLASTNGTCIVAASPSSGAATVRVDHNIFECEGGGAMNLNTLGEWIVKDNEEETLNAITNADSAIFDFVSVTLMQFDGNASNSHAHANYDVYVHDAVTNSYFANLSAVSAVTSAYKVGSGLGNVYEYNNSGNGPSHVYNIDYPGIRTNQLYGGKGIAQGCGITTTGVIPNTFCREIEEISPGTSTTANGQFITPALASGNIAALLVGQDFSTGNDAELQMLWNGTNNAANRAQVALANGQPLSIDINGNTSTNGTIASVAGFKAAGVTGVDCAAATVTLMTLVVTKGIITHC